MKRVLAVVVVLLLVCGVIPFSAAADAGTEITAAFTDPQFLAAVYEWIGKTPGTPIYEADVAEIGYLGLYDLGIKDLSGLEYFTALMDFQCGGNPLSELDVSRNTQLMYLSCYRHNLTTIDVSKNTALCSLYLDDGELTALDVSKNTELYMLSVDYNWLTELDLSHNTALEYLYVSGNALASKAAIKGIDALDLRYFSMGTQYPATVVLPEEGIARDFTDIRFLWSVYAAAGKFYGTVLYPQDVAGITELNVSDNSIRSVEGLEHFTGLTHFDCSYNRLTALNVSKNKALETLRCGGNNLTNLTLNGVSALKELWCAHNALTALDLSENTLLESLICWNNQITALDLTPLTNLQEADVSYMKLTALDVSKNTQLTFLECGKNAIKTLDISKNTQLTVLYVYDTQLTALDVSQNTALNVLLCYNNNLTTLNLTNTRQLSYLDCSGNRLEDPSKLINLPDLDVYSFEFYPQQNTVPLPGDVDVSGSVDSSDARCILQWEVALLQIDNYQCWVSDVNHDWYIDSSDARLILQYEVELVDELMLREEGGCC